MTTEPRIELPGDVIVEVCAAGICGSDLWVYKGIATPALPAPLGHEVIGWVRDAGAAVTGIRPGEFVVVPFTHSDNTCRNCQAGVQSACLDAKGTEGGQAEYVRVAHASGTLVQIQDPQADMHPSLLALSDVMATGWHAAVSADVKDGQVVVIIGDGAVALCAALACAHFGAAHIYVTSVREPRRDLARRFGATGFISQRGDQAVEEIEDCTHGAPDAILECTGTQVGMDTALKAARPGSTVASVGAPYELRLPPWWLFTRSIRLTGGMAPVRRYLPQLIDLVMDGTINPGLVFDTHLPLSHVAEGYRQMESRDALKVLLRPGDPGSPIPD